MFKIFTDSGLCDFEFFSFKFDKKISVSKSNSYLIVGDDFNFAMLENTDARVGGSEINSDCGGFRHFE